jgi:putative hemolysin
MEDGNHIPFFSSLLSRLSGKKENVAEEDVVEKEIISMVNEGHEQGVILAEEAEMISNIFEFTDLEASDIMTHRKNMTVMDRTITLEQAYDDTLHTSYSRFPVYEGDIDNIIGVMHIKDIMLLYKEERYRQMPIGEVPGLIANASFIPETRNISNLFKKMQKQKIHMVIVVDEYGQTAGLVTLEDILEEIVGNIFDEHDEEFSTITAQPDGTYLMDGMTDLEDVEDALEISFEEEDIDTLNGLLISLLDKIPEEGEQMEVTHMGYCFRIISVENKMIKTVKVSKAEPEPEPEEE